MVRLFLLRTLSQFCENIGSLLHGLVYKAVLIRTVRSCSAHKPAVRLIVVRIWIIAVKISVSRGLHATPLS